MVIIVNISVFIIFLLSRKLYNKNFLTQHFTKLSSWDIQIASILLCFSYSLNNFLYVRICLSIACTWFILFSISKDKVVIDILAYNLIMVALNLKHAISLLYQRRYVEFSPEHQQIYENVFRNFMSRTDYEKLVNISVIRDEKAGVWLKMKNDEVTSLTMIIDGTIYVKNSQQEIINRYTSNESPEAPEWIRANLRPESTRFKVSYLTANNIRYIKWSKEILSKLLEENIEIKNGLRAVLGIQTANMWGRSIDLHYLKKENSEQGNVIINVSEDSDSN